MPTYGVSIAVPEPHGSRLQEQRAGFGDPLAESVPTHITLLPPADATAGELDALCAALAGVAGDTSPFEVTLRGTGTFRPVSPVVFVSVAEGAEETGLLADRLRDAVAAPRAEFPFHPHVTVAHHLDDASLDRAREELRDYTCTFGVREFALYLHEDEVGWRPHVTFALGG